MAKTWDDCREKYKYWGTMYERWQKKFPDYVLSDKGQKIFQSCKILMKNMIDLVNLLEATPDFDNVSKSVGRTTLALGFFEDEIVTGCAIDWLNKQQKYQISFSEVNFVVSLEQVVPTIQRHLKYQQDTNTFNFQGLRNWSWEKCRHRFLLGAIGYKKSLIKHADPDPDAYAEASQVYQTTSEKMIALFDLLEADPQITNAKKRIGHNWLFLRLKSNFIEVGMSIEWITETEKFHIHFGQHDKNGFMVSLENVIPTINQYIDNQQDHHLE